MEAVDWALVAAGGGLLVFLFRDELGLGGVPQAPLAPQVSAIAPAPSAAPPAVWRPVEDLSARLQLIEDQKAKCSGRRLQKKRCKKRLDKEAKKLLRRGSGGGFAQGASAFGQVLSGAADVVGAAVGGQAGGAVNQVV